MKTALCIFEDQSCMNLRPLNYLRPVYDLRCGIRTLRQKITDQFSHCDETLHCRAYLEDLVKQENPDVAVNKISGDKCTFINGRVLFSPALLLKISSAVDDCLFVANGIVIAAVMSGDNLTPFKNKLENFLDFGSINNVPRIEVEAVIINYPWDLIKNNGDQIVQDFRALTGNRSEFINGIIYDNVTFVNKKDIFIESGTKVKPGVVLDAEEGPIYIDKNAHIMANAVIVGPTYIGRSSAIKIAAKIYENTSIGEVCKVGGEVEGSIIHAYSNKQHDGFLGHAYLGKWVNLGADTNNSDLKNNYGNVKVTINGKQIDSGSMFVGLTMGDHSKSSINTMFNTGTVVGVCSNIFGTGFPPKYVPSFSWGGSDGLEIYNLDKCLSVAEKVMGRRKIHLTETERKVLAAVFEMTKHERK